MTKISRRILLVCKDGHERAFAFASDLLSWLRQQGHIAWMVVAGSDDEGYYKSDLSLVIVMGGDGTMLGVARRLIGLAVPLLGVNFGRVGFLADVQPDNWQSYIQKCLEGDLSIRSRMALHWSVMRLGHEVASGAAINDVVLSHGPLARLVGIDVCVNKQKLGLFRGDGLILSTPLGSSGYCVSAGGPLVSPDFEAIVLIPVCPFLQTLPPIIFKGTDIFDIHILQSSTECHLTADGQEGFALQTGDLLQIVGLSGAVHLMGEGPSFVERLLARGFIRYNSSDRHLEEQQ